MPNLGFRVVDDLALCGESSRTAGVIVTLDSATPAGALLEFHRLVQDWALKPSVDPDLQEVASCLTEALSNPSGQPIFCNRFGEWGFVRSLPRSDIANHDPLTHFLIRAQRAAEGAGLPGLLARGLSGVMIELEENVLIHSDGAESGVVAFRSRPGRFDFAVNDAGIGVRASLSRNATYATIDSGEALQLMIAGGHSRLGRGHGRAYRPLFVNLANRSAALRFRSGDRMLMIEGHSPAVSNGHLSHRAEMAGLSVSVSISTAASLAA